jgi:hypothetical protein
MDFVPEPFHLFAQRDELIGHAWRWTRWRAVYWTTLRLPQLIDERLVLLNLGGEARQM